MRRCEAWHRLSCHAIHLLLFSAIRPFIITGETFSGRLVTNWSTSGKNYISPRCHGDADRNILVGVYLQLNGIISIRFRYITVDG